MKTVFIFSPLILPIPAIGGGAIETLITGLINENEKLHRVRFIVLSKYDDRIDANKYKYTKFYFFDEYCIHDNIEYYSNKYKNYCNRIKLKRKVFWNRITKRFFKKPIKPISFFLYQCFLIAKYEKVDFVVNEGNWNGIDCVPFYKIVGKQNVYYHLHYTRDEDLDFRKTLPNSIAISEYVSKVWAKDKTIVGKNYILYNGIDISSYDRIFSKEKIHHLREKIGLKSSDFVVIFCGRIIPEKGVEPLLKAFELLKEYSNIKLIMIGNVGFENNQQTDFSSMMLSIAKKMKNVFYLGFLPNEELPLYYKAADIQVIPSIWQEGAGLVAIEGMASGLPLLITKSGGMTEYVDNQCSIQIPIDNELAKNLSIEILQLSRNTAQREKMSKAGLIRAKKFSIENYYNNYINLLEQE